MESNVSKIARVIREALMAARDAEGFDGIVDVPKPSGIHVIEVTMVDDEIGAVFTVTVRET